MIAKTNESIWVRGADRDEPRRLTETLDVDVVVVGGGITGLTTALIAASDGHRVALLEGDRFGCGASGASSAHVTAVPDLGYRSVLERCGNDAGCLYVAALRDALDLMNTLVTIRGIDCGWERVPAYWFAEDAEGLDSLAKEAVAAEQLGQPCQLVESVPLPWPVAGGLAFPDQALFQPLQYLLAIADLARARGAMLFEESPVVAWEETANGVIVRTATSSVRAGALVLATHTPLGFNLVQTELAPVQSYLLALALPEAAPAALFWDTAEPYHYLRPLRMGGQSMVLIGGADHKTGHEAEPQVRYAQLADYARARFAGGTAVEWWSAQLYEPADGLPYIGRSPMAQRVFIATGFAGVGLVQGTMAAIELGRLLCGHERDTVWKATRIKLAAAPRLVTDTLDVAACWMGDRLTTTNGYSTDDLPAGQGRIVRVDGHRRAAYRDEEGRLHVLSPVCTHMGCLVRWNTSARTWDCPCHGARYAATGEVLEGPALRALTRIDENSAPYAGVAPITPECDVQRLDTDKG
jgi:glycine/D-amino acid oxidase-like deaminating enzyme/nitrite reductase/ring-hydroxylating ferredoxin subunit